MTGAPMEPDPTPRYYYEALIQGVDERLSQAIADRDERAKLALDGTREAMKLALEATQEAITKSETANDKRLDLLNDITRKAAERDVKFVQQDVYDEKHGAVVARIDLLEKTNENSKGQWTGATSTIALVLSIMSAIGVFGYLLVTLAR